jgi:hypothetical protein
VLFISSHASFRRRKARLTRTESSAFVELLFTVLQTRSYLPKAPSPPRAIVPDSVSGVRPPVGPRETYRPPARPQQPDSVPGFGFPPRPTGPAAFPARPPSGPSGSIPHHPSRQGPDAAQPQNYPVAGPSSPRKSANGSNGQLNGPRGERVVDHAVPPVGQREKCFDYHGV